MKDEEYPGLYRAASAASDAAQAHFFRLLRFNLAIFVIVSALSAFNADSPRLWFTCGALLVANFLVTLTLAILKPEQEWYAARAIAESVKTATWRFMVRAEPFNADENASVQLFVQRLKDIFEQNKKFSCKFVHAIDGPQVPEHLCHIRNQPLADRKLYYREFRVLDQKRWYTKRSGKNWRASRWCFVATLGFMGVAILVYFWRATEPKWDYWPGDTLIAAAIGMLTWMQAKRYRELGESYSLAAQEIALIETALPAIENEADFSSFVSDAENAFSREHTQWIARKDK